MNSRLNNAEEWISYLEDGIMEITKSEHQRKMKKKKESYMRFMEYKACQLIHNKSFRRWKRKGDQNVCEEIMAENFSNF